MWPLGVSSAAKLKIFGGLNPLFCARRAIAVGPSTELSRAIGVLHNEYRGEVFWWELVELARRLVESGA